MAQLLESTLTTSEAARRLAVSSERVRQLARQGALKATATPLGMLLDARSVDELAEVRRRQHKGENRSGEGA